MYRAGNMKFISMCLLLFVEILLNNDANAAGKAIDKTAADKPVGPSNNGVLASRL